MLRTRQEDRTVNRPIAKHGRTKPDRALVIALLELRIPELPAGSIRRTVLELMIASARQ